MFPALPILLRGATPSPPPCVVDEEAHTVNTDTSALLPRDDDTAPMAEADAVANGGLWNTSGTNMFLLGGGVATLVPACIG